MPKMVELEINPSFKPADDEAKAVLTDAKELLARKRAGGYPMRVPYASAVEAMKNSKGMYRIKPEEPATGQVSVVRLEDQPSEQLKTMMVALGATRTAFKKNMPRADMIAFIRRKLAEIEVDEE